MSEQSFYQQNEQGQYQYTYYQNLNNSGGYNSELDLHSKELSRLSVLCGAAVLGFILMRDLISVFLKIFNLVDRYTEDVMFQIGFGSVAQILYIVCPFLIVFLFFKTEQKEKVSSFFEKPKSWTMFLFAIFSGLMICTLGDFAGDIFTTVAGGLGMDFEDIDVDLPDDLIGNILLILEGAVVPALVEEFAFRGVIMQPLRKFGDKFAIIMTAFLFAFMHGNMMQIPFAFIAGIALGYFSIATGSIWTSVAIHFLNNFWSYLFSIYYKSHPNSSTLIFYLTCFAVITLGTVSIILFFKNKNSKLEKNKTEMKNNLKLPLYICTPTLALSISLQMRSAIQFTEFTSGAGAFITIFILVMLFIFVLWGRMKIYNENRIIFNGMYTVSTVITAISVVRTMFIMISSILTVK